MDTVLRDATSLESCCYEPYILGQKQLMRPLDSRTRTTTSTRINLNSFRVLSKNRHPGNLHCLFFIRKDSTVIYIEGG